MNVYYLLFISLFAAIFCYFTIGVIPVIWMIIGAFISSVLYMVWHKWRRKPSKGTFALATLSALCLCLTTGIIATSDNLFELIANYVFKRIGLPEFHNTSPYPTLIFLFAIAALIYLFSKKAFETWDAPPTVSELKLAEDHRDKSLTAILLNQIQLILKNQSDPVASKNAENWKDLPPDLPTPQERKDLLKDLLQSYKREIIIKADGWRDDGKYWIGEIFGAETSSSFPLIAFIFDKTPTSEEISSRIRSLIDQNIDKKTRFFAIYLSENHTKEISSKITVDGNNIEIVSSREMIFKSLDLKGYAREILNYFKTTQVGGTKATLENTFVEIKVETRNGTEFLSQKLREWSHNKSNLNIALIGEYGQGKSTAVLKYCCEWAERFIADNEIKEKVPLLIELRGRNPSETDPLAFLSTWCSRYGLIPQQVYNLIKAGDAIVIFEGFDELKNSGRIFDRYQHFNALWRFAYPGTKLIFTGRPNFFLDQSEANRTLRNNSEIHSTGGLCTEVWNIKKFDKNQIKLACRSYSRHIIDGLIRSINIDDDFYDIVTRPSMLPVVATIWDEIEDLKKNGVQLTGAVLIERYIRAIFFRKESELQRDHVLYDSPTGSRYLLLPRAVREFLTICVAWRMSGAEAQNTIARSDIILMVKDCYDELLANGKAECADVAISKGLVEFEQRNRETKKTDIIEMITTEICSSGLLVPDPAGGSTNLRFPHKQFYEFLIARSVYIVSSPKSIVCSRILKLCSSEKSIMPRLNNEKNSIHYLAECSGDNLKIFFGIKYRILATMTMLLVYINFSMLNLIDKIYKGKNSKKNGIIDLAEKLMKYEPNRKHYILILSFFSIITSIYLSIEIKKHTNIDIYKLYPIIITICTLLNIALFVLMMKFLSKLFDVLIYFLNEHWKKEENTSNSFERFLIFSIRALWLGKIPSNEASTDFANIDQFLYPALNFEKRD